MRRFAILISCLIIVLGFAFSCKNRTKTEVIPVPVFTVGPDSAGADIPDEKREIFYGIMTPVEISAIFNRLGALYDKDMLNPNESADNYLSSSKAALNLGVYGVDLSYLKMFDLNSQMIQYMLSIRTLSSRLSIPAEYLIAPIRKLENNMTDSDSLMIYVNSAYKRIEDHLVEDDRKSTAGLMVLGGWIEALYIATELLLDANDPDPEVVARIAEQKYTLNTLLSFLKNYYDDPVVVYYTKKLKFLKKYFDKFDITFDKSDLEIDRGKKVLRASGSEMSITIENLKDIKAYARKMRMETIEL